MKFKNILIVITLVCLILSCNVKKFDSEDLMWFKSFSKTDTIIFISDKYEKDTIIFFKTESWKESIRDFERGFYDTHTLIVQYSLTKGSYHQSSSPTKKDNLLRLTNKSGSDHTEFEIKFLGIIFNGNELKNIEKIDDKHVLFDRTKATYPEINISEGIKSFKFNFYKGVIEYTDIRNIKWKRK
jgi:hypothetical protein